MPDNTNQRWELGKNEHKHLSNDAASNYDDYAEDDFATRAYMDKEEEVIRSVAAMSADLSIALDLGSGTGRDSFVLAEKFDQVFGYEFSENMIREANRKRLKNHHGNVAFRLFDLESESLPHQDATVGLVNAGFGMGSFLKEPKNLFETICKVLVPQGYAIFSFYNKDSYACQLSLPWELSLAAIPDADSEHLNVELSKGGRTYKPSAKCYTVTEVKDMLSQHYSVISLETYPSLSILMPQKMLSDSLAAELFKNVDNALAPNQDIAAGHYIIAVCQKAGRLARPEPSRGFKRAFELICREGLANKMRCHAPIKTMEEAESVMSHLGVSREDMLKSVIIAEKRSTNPAASPQLWLVVTQAHRNVDFSKVSKLVDATKNNLELAKPCVLEKVTGFMIGAIPPFAMPKTVPVIFDLPIADLLHVWCGTGDPTQSIQIPIHTLENIATCSYHDVSENGSS